MPMRSAVPRGAPGNGAQRDRPRVPGTARVRSSPSIRPAAVRERFLCTMPLALLALAVVAFGHGTTEFATMELLPQIADGVGFCVPDAVALASAFAHGV